MTADGRDGARNDIHAALPDEWHVARASHDPGRWRWSDLARSPRPVGRGRAPEGVVGDGEDELAALTDLA